MKRKMFIGSSREGLTIARTIKDKIESTYKDWLEVIVWEEGDIFTMNNNTLDCLIKASMTYDYAVLVASNDDTLLTRNKQHSVARDNVIFEEGLFLGSLGKNRTLLVVDKAITLPSDFKGVTTIQYDKDNMGNIIEKIFDTINKTKNSYSIKALPSAALALGYFDNYIIPFVKKKNSLLNVIIPRCFQDISNEIYSYKANNPSKECGRLIRRFSRPIGYKYRYMNNKYWDIPTTLQTIKKLVDLLFPHSEIGFVQEKNELIKREMECFGCTLERLIEQEKMCKDRVWIEYL